ncbi:MFS transporter [Paraferrimonas sp. SM1919]|uniref:MFS transporter n=1 Tax=Paraferrimonas sp. SM1919 TaxID=2662263 RepID=UPI001969A4BE|nr:MFS transporter [Paraferrimonas sp. SM1919]
MAQTLGVKLSSGITKGNFYSYLFVVLISSAYAGALSILQPGLLQTIGVEQSHQGAVTGMLGAIQEAVFIIMMALYGSYSDKCGRRRMYLFGLFFTALGFALYGTASSINELIIYRLIIAFGSAAMVTMMVTVVADYTLNESRGRANGFQGLVATLGAFIPPILAGLPQKFVEDGMTQVAAQQATWAVAGAMGVFAIAAALFGMAKKDITAKPEPFWLNLKKGAAVGKQPKIALSYGAAFISRGDLAVTGAFMGLWLTQHGINNLNLTVSEAMAQLVMPSVIMVVLGAAVGAILMGLLADKINRVTAVSIASGLAGVIYTSMFFVSDPSADWVKALLFVMGIAEISAFVSSQALAGEQAPEAQRGAIFGFFGVAGAIGILVGTAGGGYLFSHIGQSAPFVLFGILNLSVWVWSLWVRAKDQQVLQGVTNV